VKIVYKSVTKLYNYFDYVARVASHERIVGMSPLSFRIFSCEQISIKFDISGLRSELSGEFNFSCNRFSFFCMGVKLGLSH
jgi:hypothetical protein